MKKFIKLAGILNVRQNRRKIEELFLNVSSVQSVYSTHLKYYIKTNNGDVYQICMADYYEVLRFIKTIE